MIETELKEIENTCQRVAEREWRISTPERLCYLSIVAGSQFFTICQRDLITNKPHPFYRTKSEKEAGDVICKCVQFPNLIPELKRRDNVQFFDKPRPRLFDVKDWLEIQKTGDLTPTEGVILRKICKGMSVQETAELMGIESGTIKTHLRSIYRRFGVKNSRELFLRCLELVLGREKIDS